MGKDGSFLFWGGEYSRVVNMAAGTGRRLQQTNLRGPIRNVGRQIRGAKMDDNMVLNVKIAAGAALKSRFEIVCPAFLFLQLNKDMYCVGHSGPEY